MVRQVTCILILHVVITWTLACEPLQWRIQKEFFLDCIRGNELNFEALQSTPKDDLCRKLFMAMDCTDHLVACSGSHFKQIQKLVNDLKMNQFSLQCSFERMKRTKRSALPGFFSSSSNSYSSSSNHDGYGHSGSASSPIPQNSKTKYAYKAVDKAADKVRQYVDSKYNKNGDSKRAQMAAKVINKVADKAKKMLDKKLNKRTNGFGSGHHSFMPVPIPMGGHTSSFNTDFDSSFLGSGGSSSLLSNFGQSSALRGSSFGSILDRTSNLNNHDTTGIASGFRARSNDYASGPKTGEDLMVFVIPCSIQDKSMMALIDTTSPISTISMDIGESLGYGSMDKDEIIGKQILGIPLKFDGKTVDFPLTMVRNQPVEIALGTDFLSGTGTVIDLHRNKMSIPSLGIEVDLIRPSALSTNFEKKMAVWSANP